ncbi:MAG TPA: hypothetical protein VIQ24_08960 [Pyrinomonadaceae bacterium]
MPKKKDAKTKVSSKDIQSVAEKLDGFLKELPEQEQNVLGWILTRAQAAPPAEIAAAASLASPDIKGFRSPTASQLARAVGLGPAKGPDVTVVVGWQYRFGKGIHEVDLTTTPAVRTAAASKAVTKLNRLKPK